MPAPTVSVIIPCFNAERFISTALQSVLVQTECSTEIIVVDDGSTDSSRELIRERFPSIRLIERPNAGAAAARNAGLRASTGSLVGFLDADDWWHPRKLETQIRHLSSCNSCGGVFADWRECSAPEVEPWLSISEDPSVPDPNTLRPDVSGWLYRHLLADCVIHTSSVLFRRSVLEQVGYFREDLKRGQDLEYWIRASRVAPIHKLAAVLSAYRIYHGSATTRVMSANFRALIIEDALIKWGLADPEGHAADPDRIKQVLRNSWKDFAVAHVQHGSGQIALQSLARAREYGGFGPDLIRPYLRALGKAALDRSGATLDPRHRSSQALKLLTDAGAP